MNSGLECALWPSLYPYTSWCETTLSGDGTRSSTTRSFLLKVKSEIADYANSFELVQFHYDLWLFRTVSGAISTGIRNKCCPSRSLENKIFSPQFWKWHHLCLVDAVRQLGFPQLFITISPYKWTFPFHRFISDLQKFQGKVPTENSALETLQIAHVLEQLCKGYLTGCNSSKWRNHLFRNKDNFAEQNVQNYFYRLEFQGRGTCHVHLFMA
jgi:hypothetical protein